MLRNKLMYITCFSLLIILQQYYKQRLIYKIFRNVIQNHFACFKRTAQFRRLAALRAVKCQILLLRLTVNCAVVNENCMYFVRLS